MKKLYAFLVLIVLSLVVTNTVFATESVVDEEAIVPETSAQSVEGQIQTSETAVKTTPLHSVWPFSQGNQPLPGDPEIKQSSSIDEVKVDLSVDPEDKETHPSLPEAD